MAEDGFWGNFNQATGAMDQQKLQQALAISNQIMQQRQSEHQQQMDSWQKDPENPINKYHSALAAGVEQQRQTQADAETSAEEDKKQRAELANQQGALSAFKALMDQGLPEQAWAAGESIWPEGFKKMAAQALTGKQNQFQQQQAANPTPPSQGQMIPEQSPQGQMPPGMPQAMPSMGGLSSMAQGIAGVVGPAAPQGMPQGSATAGPPAGGSSVGGGMSPLPPAAQNAAPMPFVGPQASPGTMMEPGTTPGPQPPTMQDLMQAQSPAFLQKAAKDAAAAEAVKLRAQAAGVMAKVAEGKLTVAQNKQSLDDKAFEAKVGKFAPSAAAIQRRLDIMDDRAATYEQAIDNMEKFHNATTKIADRNATTNEKNAAGLQRVRDGALPVAIYKQMGPQIIEADKRVDKLAIDTITAKQELATKNAALDLTKAQSDANPSDVLLATKLSGDATRAARAAERYDTLQAQVEAEKTAAAALRTAQGQMQKVLVDKGLITFSDGKGAGSVPRLPRQPTTAPSAPAAPKSANPVDFGKSFLDSVTQKK